MEMGYVRPQRLVFLLLDAHQARSGLFILVPPDKVTPLQGPSA